MTDAIDVMGDVRPTLDLVRTLGPQFLGNPEEAIAEMDLAIDNATDLAAILAKSEAMDADDFLDQGLQIYRVRFNASDIGNSEGCYAVISATVGEDRRRVVITCGAHKVMRQLIRMIQLDLLPVTVKFVKSAKASSNGYFPVWLEPATTIGF